MGDFKSIIADLRLQAVVDQKVCNGLRIRKSYYQDRHRGLSFWHLRLASNAWNMIRDIRHRFPKTP